MKDQPTPTEITSQTRASCRLCKFSKSGDMDPATLQTPRYCTYGPIQLNMVPMRQGLASVSGHPSVTESNWCWRFVLATPADNIDKPEPPFVADLQSNPVSKILS